MQADQAPRPSSAIARVSRGDGVPASVAQERLWRLQQALPGMPFFNSLYALRVTSPFDVAVLERSINEIVRRHEILRTTFGVIGRRHVQVIAPQLTVPLTFDDLRGLPGPRKETVAHQLVQEQVLHSFDLSQGPLLRGSLVRLAEQEHLLLITMHQVICDRWSLGVLVNELVALYDAFSAGEVSPLAPLPISVRGLCILAAALAITSGHRCAARILARAASRPTARDAARHRPSEADNGWFPHSAAGMGVAGQPVGGRQTFQPPRRLHVVHDARRCSEDAVASLHGSGGLASGD